MFDCVQAFDFDILYELMLLQAYLPYESYKHMFHIVFKYFSWNIGRMIPRKLYPVRHHYFGMIVHPNHSQIQN